MTLNKLIFVIVILSKPILKRDYKKTQHQIQLLCTMELLWVSCCYAKCCYGKGHRISSTSEKMFTCTFSVQVTLRKPKERGGDSIINKNAPLAICVYPEGFWVKGEENTPLEYNWTDLVLKCAQINKFDTNDCSSFCVLWWLKDAISFTLNLFITTCMFLLLLFFRKAPCCSQGAL